VSAVPDPQAAAVTVIEPPSGVGWPDWRELWAHRELVYVLARRDIAIKYKQTAIGATWAVLQPLSLAAVFSLFFGLLAHIKTGSSVPYPVFAIVGMVTWIFFTSAFMKVSDSTVMSAPLIEKVYFPRLIIPLAAVFAPAVDFAIGFGVALAVTLAYGIVPPVQIVLVPFVLLLVLSIAFGIGTWLAAVHVKYRDIGNLVGFLILVGLFITPIVYPFSNIPSEYHVLYGLNPMVGILELMRWMMFPDADFPGLLALVPIVESVVLVLAGILYFERSERDFADVI
jgi:lipopolysaccharide transport system permease protein